MNSNNQQKKISQSQGVNFRRETLELPEKTFRFSKYLTYGILILIIVALIYGGYRGRGYFQKYISRDNSVEILAEVGKLVILPANEEPTIATVTNPESLAGQQFFKDAKVGDKVLIFSKSKKALLYRPSEKRIIVVAPLKI